MHNTQPQSTEASPITRPAPGDRQPTIVSLIERLAAIPPGRYQVLSCYLQLRPEDRERRVYRTALKHRVQRLEQSGALDRLARTSRLAVEREIARLLTQVERPGNLPHARGLAVFACEALGLFAVVPLPGVRRTRLVLDDTPWIRELVAVHERFGRVLVVVLDRAHARFFQAAASGVEECACIAPPAKRGGKFHGDRRDAPGWGERDYQSRIKEERHRHYADVVHMLEDLTRRHPIRGLVIAGPLEHTAAFVRFLPQHLAARLMGTIRLNPTAATAAQVQAAAFEAANAHERITAAALVASLEEALGTGWAVEGPRETLRALARGQVRQLFLRADLIGGGYRCAATGRLVGSRGECRGEGEPLPVHDLADEVLEEAFRQRVDVVMLDNEQHRETIDNYAAILRFR